MVKTIIYSWTSSDNDIKTLTAHSILYMQAQN